MKKKQIYSALCNRKLSGKKSFGLLIDPDKVDDEKMEKLLLLAIDAGVDFFLVGGSLVISDYLDNCVKSIKRNCDIPVLLFPGNNTQVSKFADALLYLSLISGRNPDLLIGQHVISAPAIKASGLEVISTGYMVVDGGVPTTVSYMSHSAPLPANKPDLALCTAWAGELLGKHLIYMDAGSGAKTPISKEMIKKVSKNIELPLVIGGGIRTAEKVRENCEAGAQIIVVGNAIEKDINLIKEMCLATKS